MTCSGRSRPVSGGLLTVGRTAATQAAYVGRPPSRSRCRSTRNCASGTSRTTTRPAACLPAADTSGLPARRRRPLQLGAGQPNGALAATRQLAGRHRRRRSQLPGPTDAHEHPGARVKRRQVRRHDIGRGSCTMLRQIAADALGTDVDVELGDSGLPTAPGCWRLGRHHVSGRGGHRRRPTHCGSSSAWLIGNSVGNFPTARV